MKEPVVVVPVFQRVCAWIAILALSVIPWLICDACGGNALQPNDAYLLIAGKMFGPLLGITYFLAYSQHTSPVVQRRVVIMQTALLLSAFTVFITLWHLRQVSAGKLDFCPYCWAFWSAVAVLLVEHVYRTESKTVMVWMVACCLSTGLLLVPGYKATWGRVYAAIILPQPSYGLRAGVYAPDIAQRPTNGIFVLWSNCPPCREDSKKELRAVVEELSYQKLPVTVVAVAGMYEAADVEGVLPGLPIVEVGRDLGERVYRSYNIPLKTYPYVVVVRGGRISSLSRFCDGEKRR